MLSRTEIIIFVGAFMASSFIGFLGRYLMLSKSGHPSSIYLIDLAVFIVTVLVSVGLFWWLSKFSKK